MTSKKEASRRRLIEAAVSLFQDRGFDSVTVDEIAAAAEVSLRNFFRYFPAKEAAVFSIVLDRPKTFRQVIRAQTGGRPADIEDMNAVFVELVKDWM